MRRGQSRAKQHLQPVLDMIEICSQVAVEISRHTPPLEISLDELVSCDARPCGFCLCRHIACWFARGHKRIAVEGRLVELGGGAKILFCGVNHHWGATSINL